MARKGTIEKGSRTALVTGAGSGIGHCMVRRLAELGYRLILAGLDPAKLEAAAEELHEQYGLAVEVIPIDLARPEAAHELFERVQALGREVDVLVNNAGAFSFRDILQTPVERIEKILCLHALTTTLTCRLFGAEMSRRGCGGHILNMASYSLWMPWPGLALYSASKSYLRSFSVAFAKEVREQNIRVTAVCPAGVATDLYGLPPRWQRSCWGISMARATVPPGWKPPLMICSPAAGRGIPCSAPSTPRESCGPSPSSPPPTAGPWGCS